MANTMRRKLGAPCPWAARHNTSRHLSRTFCYFSTTWTENFGLASESELSPVRHSAAGFRFERNNRVIVTIAGVRKGQPSGQIKFEPLGLWMQAESLLLKLQPIASRVSFNLILHFQPDWFLLSGIWQKKGSELYNRLIFEIGEMTLHLLFLLNIYCFRWFSNCFRLFLIVNFLPVPGSELLTCFHNWRSLIICTQCKAKPQSSGEDPKACRPRF